jgi:uroporphyrinogen decarboxylase
MPPLAAAQLPLAGMVSIGVPGRNALENSASAVYRGNLDPHALLLPEADYLKSLEAFFDPVLALPASRRRGWICGLGHGVLPATPEHHVRLFVDLQRELFQ